MGVCSCMKHVVGTIASATITPNISFMRCKSTAEEFDIFT